MVSLICFIRSFFVRNEIIQVRRTPPTKVLRPHLLGLTIGFALTSLNLVFGLTADNLFQSAIFLLWFALTTYVGGILLLITAILFILLKIISPPAGSFGYLLMVDAHWYFLGYAFGAVFGILYNDLIWLYLNTFERKKIKIAFAYDPKKRFNVIKSPIPEEERALNELFHDKPHLKERRLYRYRTLRPDEQPEQPYTIVFVANPRILKRGDEALLDENLDASYYTDPIVYDRELFLRGVDRALFSLERNSVVGRPEIWSRVRIITLFNPKLAKEANSGPQYGLIGEERLDRPDERNNIVITLKRMLNLKVNGTENTGSFMRIIDKSIAADADEPALAYHDFDVIFVMTASPRHDRSTAWSSDFVEPAEEVDEHVQLVNEDDRPGTPYEFDVDPCGNKEKDRDGNPVVTTPNTMFPNLDRNSFLNPNKFRTVHDFYSIQPGRVALNVLGARNYTFIHEFGHAMASAFHGAIGDEYFDPYNLLDPRNGEISGDKIQPRRFIVNRIERSLQTMRTATPIPTPKVFAEYNCTHYPTDLEHPPAEEGWIGYFPEKHDRVTFCIMDNDAGGNHFDELLSAFMYDRLMAKTIRPRRAPAAPLKKAAAKARGKAVKGRTAKAKA
jgi:hypothetical protein